jgi:protein gp37
MSENTNIEWTDHTFNPWIGCTKVSPGCLNCYAETLDKRRLSKTLGAGTKETPVLHWGRGAPRHRTSEAYWKQPLRWEREQQALTARYGTRTEGSRPRIFCASLADWLDDEVPIEWLADLLDLIRATPSLDWQLLTKRPENFLPRLEAVIRSLEASENWDNLPTYSDKVLLHAMLGDWLLLRRPPANVWLGTTAEDQNRADTRIPQLLAIPAKVRFLSCEPLLEPVDLTKIPDPAYPLCEGCDDGKSRVYFDSLTGRQFCDQSCDGCEYIRRIDWVITGGESGSGHRPFDPEWARSLRDQCTSSGTAFFMKQMGGARKPFPEIPADLHIRQFPTLT